jgi:hypothetical protein
MPTIKPLKVTPDARKAKAAAKASSRRQKEGQRRRAERTAYLKRYGVLAALGIAATLAVVLLIAKWNKPTDTDNASPKDASAVYGKSTGASAVEQSAGQAKVSANGVENVAGRHGNDADSTALPKANKGVDGKKIYNDNTEKEVIADGFVDYLKAHGVKVEENGIGAGVIGQRPVPPNTIRVYRPPSTQTEEKEPSR